MARSSKGKTFLRSGPPRRGKELSYTPSIRAERLVASGRFALASASLAAVWLDPSAPSRYAGLAYALMSVYAIYALVVALVAWQRPARTVARRLATHVLDLLVFTAVIYLTEGATSPFFLYFIFSLLSATLRFRLRGTFWTAVAALLIFIGIGSWTSLVLNDPNFELNRFLVRSVYLAIASVLLIYLSVHQEQHRHELWSLADWPRLLPESLSLLMAGLLSNAASTMRSDRVFLLWRRREEESRTLSWLEDEECRSVPWNGPGVAAALEDSDFYCRDLHPVHPSVVRTDEREPEVFLDPLTDDLRARLGATSVLSVRVDGTRVAGRLFILDARDVTTDDMVLGRIVSEILAARLDEFFLLGEVRNVAVSEERIRVSREIHDGVLQSLTGIALQLRVAEKVLAAEPERAITILNQVRDLIVQNQRELRDFVHDLREREPMSTGVPLSLRMMALAERARIEWAMRVRIDMDEDREIPAAVARELTPLVNEAIANAGRHGRADLVQVRLRIENGLLRLDIRDNGRGFPFEGRYDLEDLDRREIGPLTLRERVGSLRGEMILDTSSAGAVLEIAIPLESREEAT